MISGNVEKYSRIFKCKVRHERLSPKRHRFSYGIFMLYLDLDHLKELEQSAKLFSVNHSGPISFWECDHFKAEYAGQPAQVADLFPASDSGTDSGAETLSLADKIRVLARCEGVDQTIDRVMLLTMPRILGYVFNPVSFYFLFGENKSPLGCVVEVGNTFAEMKMYVVRHSTSATREAIFRLIAPKHFYVSPFGKLDDKFDFILPVPDDRLHIAINTVNGDANEKVLLSNLSGGAEAFTSRQLALNFIQFPLLTLKVIALIHWHALLLALQKVPFVAKEADLHLQTSVLNKKERFYARAKSQG